MKPEAAVTGHPYTGPFVLSKTKLARICDILEKRFAALNLSDGWNSSFHVVLANRKTHLVSKLDAVLALDNSLKNRIRELTVRFSGGPKDEPVADVNLEFDGAPIGRLTIHIVARALDSTWLRETVAELEEQIDRVQVRGIMYRLSLSPPTATTIVRAVAVIAAFLMIVVSLATVVSARRARQPVQLSTAAIEAVENGANNAATVEEKIDTIFQFVKATVGAQKAAAAGGVDLQRFAHDFRTYFIGIPFLIILGSFLYLVVYCYPRYVFEWGDYEDHHARLIERRKAVWTVAVLSLLIGIVGNAFVFALSTYWVK